MKFQIAIASAFVNQSRVLLWLTIVLIARSPQVFCNHVTIGTRCSNVGVWFVLYIVDAEMRSYGDLPNRIFARTQTLLISLKTFDFRNSILHILQKSFELIIFWHLLWQFLEFLILLSYNSLLILNLFSESLDFMFIEFLHFLLA